MTSYLTATSIHLLVVVFWVGYILFWVITSAVLQKNFGPYESTRLKNVIKQSSWPPEPLPSPVRLSLTGLGWAFLVLLILSGGIALYSQYGGENQNLEYLFSGRTLWALPLKLTVVLALLFVHRRLVRQTTFNTVLAAFILTLAVISISTFLVR